MRLKKLPNILFIGFALISLIYGGSSFAQQQSTPSDLESQMNERSKRLEEINKQLEETRKHLEETAQERASLQKDVKVLDGNLKQLDLTIKMDEQQIGLLEEEINSINENIRHLQGSLDSKRKAITATIRSMQANQFENPLTSFLRAKTLSEGVFEQNALMEMQTKLRLDMGEIIRISEDLKGNLDKREGKRQETETRKESSLVRKNIVADLKSERTEVLLVTKNKESQYQKQVSELQKQQDALEDEISQIEKKLREKFDSSKLDSLSKGFFKYPIKLVSDGGAARITQHYGEVSSLYRGKPHNGMDFGAPVGTAVYAAADGVVIAIDNNDKSSWRKYQYGKHVLIKHPNNLASLYAHLSGWTVSLGQQVKQGDLIGYSGNTGYSTGPHLHFGVYWAPSVEFVSRPPASGRIPVGVVLRPEDYL